MEGPSLFLAKEQLKPFKKKRIEAVSGNTTIAKERFSHQVIKDIFSWGKHLVFQFDAFALKVHFLMFGTFMATVDGKSVTGDYKKTQVPRLTFVLKNGRIDMYNCSVKILEHPHLKATYDYAIDIMSTHWDSALAYRKVKRNPDEEIGDVLLDQTIFAGVGNIIKNEVLSLSFVHPEAKVKDLSPKTLKEIIARAKVFSLQFYRWRKKFVLKKHYTIYGKGACPHCGGHVSRRHTGKRHRRSHFCVVCQRLRTHR